MSGEATPGLATVSFREVFENPVHTILDQHDVKEGFEEVKEIKVSLSHSLSVPAKSLHSPSS